MKFDLNFCQYFALLLKILWKQYCQISLHFWPKPLFNISLHKYKVWVLFIVHIFQFTNTVVGIFSNGFIKLVQKTDITHSKCHFFPSKMVFHTNPHIHYVLFKSAREKSESYPLKPHPLFSSDTSFLWLVRWRERPELTGDKTEPKHLAVIKARLLIPILQLITDFKW